MADVADDTRFDRAFALAERQEAVDELRILDADVDAFIARARERRRLLVRRARRFARMAGGVNRRASDDSPPWWDTKA